jgi:threonine dehydratase
MSLPVPESLPLGPLDVKAAAARIAGRVRPVVLAPADSDLYPGGRITFACEFMQHTGTFKARGAANLAAAHLQDGTMPEAGITIASGGNAGVACAWAAKATGTRATVFLPATAPEFKVAKLRGYGAQVRLVGTEYADALAASIEYAQTSGALLSHAYDNPLIAAGAGTMTAELLAQLPDVDTIMVAVGGGGLFAGTAAAVAESGVRVVAVEPENCRALNAALEAGGPVDVTVDSVASDALGARRVSKMAFELAQRSNVRSVLVDDDAIVQARRSLWDCRRVVVEHGGAAAFAALTSGAYVPADGEHVVVVLCGANTDPASVV